MFCLQALKEFLDSPLGSVSRLNSSLTLVTDLRVTKVDGNVYREVVVNLKVSHRDKEIGIMNTTSKEEILESPTKYRDLIVKIMNTPITIMNSIIVSYGIAINGIYRMQGYKSVYKTFKLADLKYAILINKEVNGLVREQLLIVNINRNKNGRTTVTEIPELLSLNLIGRSFKLGKDVSRVEKLDTISDFISSCELLIQRWVHGHIEFTLRERVPLVIKLTNIKEIDKMYASQINTLLIEHLIDKYKAFKIDKFTLTKVILSQVKFDDNFIDSLELYSLNKEDMILAIKLTETFLTCYEYSGPTIFKLKTKINIFDPEFTLTKDINSELIGVITKEVEEIVTDFKNHIKSI